MSTSRALVLRRIPYSDSRQVVSLFTESHGMVTCMARVSRGRKAGGRGALWQTLSLLEVELDYRPQREMQTVSEASLPHPWQSIPYHPLKAATSIFLSDFLFHALRGEGHNPALFDFLEASLQWFDQAEGGAVDFHLQLMLRLTRFLGILPSVEGYSRHAMYDLKSACYTNLVPSHEHWLPKEEARLIPLLLRTGYGQMDRLRLTTHTRRQLKDELQLY